MTAWQRLQPALAERGTHARSRAIDRVRSRTSRAKKETALPETYDAPALGNSPEQDSEEKQRRTRVTSHAAERYGPMQVCALSGAMLGNAA